MKYPLLPKRADKRIKIPKRFHRGIRRRFFEQAWSLTEIAAKFSVSANAIRYIVYPDKHNQDSLGWKKRFNKRKHRLQMKKYRDRKMRLQGSRVKGWRRSINKSKKTK